MRYEWKDGSRYSVKADIVGKVLERIDKLNGGVTPSVVVESSRPDEAPLHPLFEWDDTRASELYREDQARGIIRSVRVIQADKQGEERATVAYVSVRLADADGPSYQPTARVMSDADLRRQAIADALAGLEAWVRRHEHLTELAAELRVARRVHRRAARRLKEADAAPAMV